jgi:hypothetical protein
MPNSPVTGPLSYGSRGRLLLQVSGALRAKDLRRCSLLASFLARSNYSLGVN